MAVMSPPFEGVRAVRNNTSRKHKDYRDNKDTFREKAGTTGSAPRSHEEADVASQARNAVSRPPGSEKGLRERTNARLTRVQALFCVRGACPALLAAPPPGPGQHSHRTARQGEKQASQQTAH